MNSLSGSKLGLRVAAKNIGQAFCSQIYHSSEFIFSMLYSITSAHEK